MTRVESSDHLSLGLKVPRFSARMKQDLEKRLLYKLRMRRKDKDGSFTRNGSDLQLSENQEGADHTLTYPDPSHKKLFTSSIIQNKRVNSKRHHSVNSTTSLSTLQVAGGLGITLGNVKPKSRNHSNPTEIRKFNSSILIDKQYVESDSPSESKSERNLDTSSDSEPEVYFTTEGIDKTDSTDQPQKKPDRARLLDLKV